MPDFVHLSGEKEKFVTQARNRNQICRIWRESGGTNEELETLVQAQMLRENVSTYRVVSDDMKKRMKKANMGQIKENRQTQSGLKRKDHHQVSDWQYLSLYSLQKYTR